MALIQCEDCGGNVSTAATNCPHCGRPATQETPGVVVGLAVDGARICTACQREVAWKRQIGVGTLILAMMTFGLWLLVIPLYPKRCPICRGTALSYQHEVTAGAC